MKFIITSFLLLLTLNFSFGQTTGDTIVVQAFDYPMTALGNSGNRDMIVAFPTDTTLTYEKIIMKYNMRCRDGVVNGSGGNYVGCGEWDYSCNTYIHDSTRVDSLGATHPNYLISGFSGAAYDYAAQPTYSYLQQDLTTVTLNNIIGETPYSVLNGTVPTSIATDGNNYSGKSTSVYTAAELLSAGFAAGDIDGLFLNALSGGDLNFFRVKIKQVIGASLDNTAPEITGFTEVFSDHYNFVIGQNRIQFYAPFVWDGVSDLLIEFSFTNSTPANTITIEGTTSAIGMGIYASNGIHTNVASNGHFEFPTLAMTTPQSEVSVSFWAYGDANLLPANTTVMYGVGADGGRDLSSHLPWSNSSIYFDCGDEGSGFDRINKAATPGEIAGNWHHWAFTKNAATGDMKIYLDGTLWHSGAGYTNLIEFANLVIGKDNNYNNNYKGLIDEVRLWNVELQATEIANWMNISIDNTHPNYANLVAYYKLEELGSSTIVDASPTAATGNSSSQYIWEFTRGKNLERFFEVAPERPSITIFQGDYNLTIANVTVMDSTQNIPNTVEEFTIVSNAGTIESDNVQLINTSYYWEAVDQNIYDENGVVIGTIPIAVAGTITPIDLDYLQRWPMKFEITSFVTPYGVGLNLGPNGKTWDFDLTDFSPVFRDSMRFTMERGGQWNEDYDIKFLFIVGTPPRDVIDNRQIWRNNYIGYAAIIADNYFAPRNVTLNPSASSYKIRTQITGHGQEGEFIPRTHFVNIDGGTNEFSWQVWKECAENPIYPQGGTWIYDRAGWCPGRATDLQEFDITPYVTPGQVHTIDYGLTNGSGASNYIVNNQLVSYDSPNFTTDASIVDIINPSTYVEHERVNSICTNPTIILKNTGSTVLTSATINYWVNNSATPQAYTWSGSLDFLESEVIELPSPLALWDDIIAAGPNAFHAEVVNTNGGTDEYAYNNEFVSDFTIPMVAPNHFYIYFKTNNAASESSYHFEDDMGNVIFSRSGMTNNTTYRDTLPLAAGCYKLIIEDTDDDGFDFWANGDGTGQSYLREVGGPIFKYINGDFGKSSIINFTVDYPLSYEELVDIYEVELYPNPAQDYVSLTAGSISEAEIQFVNSIGEIIEVPSSVTNDEVTFDTRNLVNGLYLIKVNYRGELQTKRLVINK